jgi:2-aminoethylphosphonate-pyruvate transaminase
MILLNPGPVSLTERVRSALLGPDLCHREPEFSELQTRIRKKLLDVYGLAGERWAAVLLTGSGTAAAESMMVSLVGEREKVLIIENGVYGERLSEIARLHRLDHLTFPHPWSGRIDLDALEARLSAHPDLRYVALVHHETTTGRLNPLAAVAARCRARGIKLLVDGVSSFGAEALEFEHWGIAACAATANKCLHGVPGVSFVMAQRGALFRGEAAPRSVYLDLARYSRLQDEGSTPFTQSVQCFYALDEALSELAEEGGWRQRHLHYRTRLGIVRQGLAELGVGEYLPPGEGSVVLGAFHLPGGVGYPALHDALKGRGYVIYAGQGGLVEKLFRVAVMGNLSVEDLRGFVAAAGKVIGDAAVAEELSERGRH